MSERTVYYSSDLYLKTKQKKSEQLGTNRGILWGRSKWGPSNGGLRTLPDPPILVFFFWFVFLVFCCFPIFLAKVVLAIPAAICRSAQGAGIVKLCVFLCFPRTSRVLRREEPLIFGGSLFFPRKQGLEGQGSLKLMHNRLQLLLSFCKGTFCRKMMTIIGTCGQLRTSP